jgi:hypothetical protein
MDPDQNAEIPEPEDFGVKEVYAFFGLASYCAQVLEKGLVNMTVAFRAKGLRITPSEFDALFEEHDKKTLGQLLRRARSAIAIPPDVDSLLETALEKRNWLAHQYFADRSVQFTEESGRGDMIRELQHLITLFRKADRATEPIYQPILRQMGVTDEIVRQLIEEMKREYRLQKPASKNGGSRTRDP